MLQESKRLLELKICINGGFGFWEKKMAISLIEWHSLFSVYLASTCRSVANCLEVDSGRRCFKSRAMHKGGSWWLGCWHLRMRTPTCWLLMHSKLSVYIAGLLAFCRRLPLYDWNEHGETCKEREGKRAEEEGTNCQWNRLTRAEKTLHISRWQELKRM